MSGKSDEDKIFYDPEKEYQAAMGQLTAMKDSLPQYTSSYDKSLRELYGEITNRPKFSYDPNDDALYQSYKQSYARQGHLAMVDTMGQAAGLTGGYGSSYAQSVGQQQYDAYLQKLGDVYPELYNMAYTQYRDEEDALWKRYEALWQQSENEYSRYQDELDEYYRRLGVLQDRADTAYDRGVAAEQEQYRRDYTDKQDAYEQGQDTLDRQNDAYDRLAEMMLTMGYVPTEEELAAAGMSEAHKSAYLRYYTSLQTAPAGRGGGGKQTEVYDSLLASAKTKLAKGATVEAVNGEIAQMVKDGELDRETAQSLMITLSKEYLS